ncbi:MAG: toprim domain-containing protein [Bacteroidota bacterium]
MDFEQAKREIDLVQLAVEAYGYQILPAKSSAKQKVLRQAASGSVIVVSLKSKEGNPWYFNPHDDQDQGTVIDFLWQRENQNWKRVKAVAQQFMSGAMVSPQVPLLPEGPKNWPTLPLSDFSFLRKRGIRDATCQHPYFQGRISHTQSGPYLNLAFPLFHAREIVGYELRNEGFKGFAPGSKKGQGFWYSHLPPANSGSTRQLLIFESALDALAYHQLHPPSESVWRVYLSTGGATSPRQQAAIQQFCESLKPHQVLLAADNDAAGQWQNLQLAIRLSPPGPTKYSLTCLLERLDPGRARLTLALASRVAWQEEAIQFLLLGLSSSGFEVSGPVRGSGEVAWLVDFAYKNLLITSALKLVIMVKGAKDFLQVRTPQKKDWNEDLKPERH